MDHDEESILLQLDNRYLKCKHTTCGAFFHIERTIQMKKEIFTSLSVIEKRRSLYCIICDSPISLPEILKDLNKWARGFDEYILRIQECYHPSWEVSYRSESLLVQKKVNDGEKS